MHLNWALLNSTNAPAENAVLGCQLGTACADAEKEAIKITNPAKRTSNIFLISCSPDFNPTQDPKDAKRYSAQWEPAECSEAYRFSKGMVKPAMWSPICEKGFTSPNFARQSSSLRETIQ